MSKHKNKNKNQQIQLNNNQPPTGIVQITTAQMIMPVAEYDNLIKENQQLKQRVAELTNQQIENLNNIRSKDLEIEILRNENKKLREKIDELEKHIKEQDEHIKQQDEHIKQQDEHIKQQDIIINDLKNDICDIKNERLYDKFKIAIQDINSRYQLEKNFTSYDICNALNNLRNDRVEGCHYIKKSDIENDVQCKIFVLQQMLNNLSQPIKDNFEIDYHKDLINEIDMCLKKLGIINTFTQQQIDKIKRWFK